MQIKKNLQIGQVFQEESAEVDPRKTGDLTLRAVAFLCNSNKISDYLTRAWSKLTDMNKLLRLYIKNFKK